MKDGVDAVEKTVDEMKHEIAELEERFEELEDLVDKIQRHAKQLTYRNLGSQLGLRPMETAPVLSESMKAKIQGAAKYLRDRKNVVILGEGGIGKSTLLQLICEKLLYEGESLFTFGLEGLRSDDIFIVDNLPAKVAASLDQILQLPCPVLVTARTNDWIALRVSKGWAREILITKEDHTSSELKEILVNLLDARKLGYEQYAVEVAVGKCQEIPEYLRSLVAFATLKQAKTFDFSIAEAAPPGIYDLIAEIISSLKNEISVATLYFIALTFGKRLHQIQLRALMLALKPYANWNISSSVSAAEEVESVLYHEHQMFYLSHDLWKDVLIDDWSRLGISLDEPSSLGLVRSLKLGKLADTIRLSEKELPRLREDDASEAATVIVENNALETAIGLHYWLKAWKPGGAIAIVVGGPGMGKTRVIESVARELSYGIIVRPIDLSRWSFQLGISHTLSYDRSHTLFVLEIGPRPDYELIKRQAIRSVINGDFPLVVVSRDLREISPDLLNRGEVFLIPEISSDVWRHAFPELLR